MLEPSIYKLTTYADYPAIFCDSCVTLVLADETMARGVLEKVGGEKVEVAATDDLTPALK